MKRKILEVLWVLVAAAFITALMLLPTQRVHAAPPVASEEECALFADLALTSRALHAEGISAERVAHLVGVIYVLPDARVMTLAALIVDKGRQSKQRPREFAVEFFKTCVAHQGNVDSFLGTSL